MASVLNRVEELGRVAANDVDEGYRPSPEEPFMSLKQQAYFRAKLIRWKEAILLDSQGTLSQLQIDSLREADLTDRASSETDWSIELRTRDRDSLFLIATLRVSGDAAAREVRIRNLSEGGLMAELGRAVDVGTAATLELRGIGEITGRIAWSTEGRVGIALDRPIDPKRARKPVGTGARTPVYAKALKRI